MPTFTQDRSPLKLSTLLGKDALLAVSLEGREGINELFSFNVDALAPSGSDIRLDRLLGTNAVVSIQVNGGPERHIHGEITSVEQFYENTWMLRHRIILRPGLARLGLVRRSRIFHQMNLPDILREVAGESCSLAFELGRQSLPTRNLVTQYRETDLEFFLRLCSEGGLAFYWRHGPEKHELVLTSRTSIAQSGGLLPFEPTEGQVRSGPRLKTWSVRQNQVQTQAEVVDSHFQKFGQQITATGKVGPKVQAGQLNLDLAAVPGPSQEDSEGVSHFFDNVNGSGEVGVQGFDRLDEAMELRAAWAAQGQSAGAVTGSGVGDFYHLQAGQSFGLEGAGAWDGAWICRKLSHRCIVQGAYWAGEDVRWDIDCHMESAPLALEQLPWPPKKKPNVGGVVTAVVTGPDGQEVFVDRYGRVKVRYLWDREALGEGGDSFWIRVAQPWAGKGYGSFFWPRVGHEVVVAFENGDPDRPIIVGSVYNATNECPFRMPANALLQGFKTRRSGFPDGSHFHTLALSDDPKNPIIHVSSDTAFVVHQRYEQQNTMPETQFNMHG
jgi:type VI secretion system secreted protein VgrG